MYFASEDILSAPLIIVLISPQLFVVIIDPHPPKEEQSRSLFPQQLQPSNQSLLLNEASLPPFRPTLPLLALLPNHLLLAPLIATPFNHLFLALPLSSCQCLL